jgi:hypothetical protein
MNTIENALEHLLPGTLDEVIRADRDKAQLYFSTDSELAALCSHVPLGPATGQISNWAFITFHVAVTQESFVYLVGFNKAENSSWMTSFVTGIDDRKVTTKSGSLYELVGYSTIDVDLEYICATLNLWGLGPRLGVPPIYF